MTIPLDGLQSPLIDAIGAALIDFVWQGALIAGIVAIGLRMLRHHTPQARYALCVLALLAMAVLPVWTAYRQYVPADSRPTIEQAEYPQATEPFLQSESSSLSKNDQTLDLKAAPAWNALRSRIAGLRPIVVFLWTLGVVFFAVRFLGGLVVVSRLKRASMPVRQAEILSAFTSMQSRFDLDRPVSLHTSTTTDEPLLIGWLKPVIILPASMLSGISPEHAEAILAHEMTHIRRHDYLVSILQSCIETLLFYHPATWWISERTRIEREQCCDDIAVQVSAGRSVYVQALAHLETRRVARLDPSLAAGGGRLIDRIRRLANPAAEISSSRGTATVLFLFLLGCGAFFNACNDTPLIEESTGTRNLALPAPLDRFIAANDIEGVITRLHEIRESGDENALAIAEAAYYAAEQEDLRRNLVFVFAHFNSFAGDEFLLQIAENDPADRVRWNAIRSFSVRLDRYVSRRFSFGTELDSSVFSRLGPLYTYPKISSEQFMQILPALEHIVRDREQPISVRTMTLTLIADSGLAPSFVPGILTEDIPDLLRLYAYRYAENDAEAVQGIFSLIETSSDPMTISRARSFLGEKVTVNDVPQLLEKLKQESGEIDLLAGYQNVFNILFYRLPPDQKASLRPVIESAIADFGPDHLHTGFLKHLLEWVE